MQTIIKNKVNRVKSLLLITGMLAIIIIASCSCTKQSNVPPSNSNTNTVIDLSGTYVNPTNSTDYITLTSVGNSKYKVTNYQYMHFNAVADDTTSNTKLTNAPGWQTYSKTTVNTTYYTCYLYYTNSTLKFTGTGSDGSTLSNVTYNKQ